jgi:single-stranded-DNA-specific exonuclease
VPGFHLRDALAEVDALYPGLIERFGGHAMAAGLTLQSAALAEFSRAMQAVGERRLSPEMLAQQIHTDGELAAAAHTLPVAVLLRDAGPWGQAFPEPRFDGSFEVLELRVLQDRHTQMKLRPAGFDASISAIAFNQCNPDWHTGQLLRLVYRLTVNEYGGRQQLQLVVEHAESECADA